MTRKNRLVRHAHISEGKFRALLRAFAVDLTATQIAILTGLNRNTVNAYLTKIRQRLANECEQASPFSGAVEVDESFFGARRMKGKRGRGAFGKTIVFGIFQRNGEVYTEIVPDCSKATLQGIIRGRVELASVIHSDGWRGYAGLVDMGYQKHLRVDQRGQGSGLAMPHSINHSFKPNWYKIRNRSKAGLSPSEVPAGYAQVLEEYGGSYRDRTCGPLIIS